MICQNGQCINNPTPAPSPSPPTSPACCNWLESGECTLYCARSNDEMSDSNTHQHQAQDQVESHDIFMVLSIIIPVIIVMLLLCICLGYYYFYRQKKKVVAENEVVDEEVIADVGEEIEMVGNDGMNDEDKNIGNQITVTNM